jgi:hypothetical protein
MRLPEFGRGWCNEPHVHAPHVGDQLNTRQSSTVMEAFRRVASEKSSTSAPNPLRNDQESETRRPASVTRILYAALVGWCSAARRRTERTASISSDEAASLCPPSSNARTRSKMLTLTPLSAGRPVPAHSSFWLPRDARCSARLRALASRRHATGRCPRTSTGPSALTWSRQPRLFSPSSESQSSTNCCLGSDPDHQMTKQ